jgi:asparagine synthase (glutamine-hydrolysing)
MCGIAGRFHPEQLPLDGDWHARADRLLAHRGPDGKGRFIDRHCELIHRRLALLDLSPTGSQPLANADESVYVVFNGEIYNHRELREDLRQRGYGFRGTSDTEVLVHLYSQYGTGMVDRLQGMFAFGIYDRKRCKLLLARDRFGIKPLFYASTASQWIFASEIKGITAVEA